MSDRVGVYFDRAAPLAVLVDVLADAHRAAHHDRVTPAQADGRVLGDLPVALHGDERTWQIGPLARSAVEGPRRPAHSHGHGPRPALGVTGPRLRGDEPDHADVRFVGHPGLLNVCAATVSFVSARRG